MTEVEFQDPVPTVNHYLPKMLSDGAELIVVLSHLGLGGDQALAKAAEAFLQRLLEPHHGALSEIIGNASGWLVRAQTLAGQEARKRAEESPIDSLFADILREQTGADVALLPGVGYGVAIPTGAITAALLRQVVPHEGQVITLRLTGDQIIQVLEQAVENVFTDDPAVKVGGMLQVAGLRFRYNPTLLKGQRVLHVEMPQDRWNPLDTYTVATNSMMAGGGHNYLTLTIGEAQLEHGSQYEMIRGWIAKQDAVATPPLGRIEKLAVSTKP